MFMGPCVQQEVPMDAIDERAMEQLCRNAWCKIRDNGGGYRDEDPFVIFHDAWLQAWNERGARIVVRHEVRPVPRIEDDTPAPASPPPEGRSGGAETERTTEQGPADLGRRSDPDVDAGRTRAGRVGNAPGGVARDSVEPSVREWRVVGMEHVDDDSGERLFESREDAERWFGVAGGKYVGARIQYRDVGPWLPVEPAVRAEEEKA